MIVRQELNNEYTLGSDLNVGDQRLRGVRHQPLGPHADKSSETENSSESTSSAPEQGLSGRVLGTDLATLQGRTDTG